MATNDFNPREDQDRNKDVLKAGEEQAAGAAADHSKHHGLTDVKNAHASGDGSYGRNDGRLTEDDEEGDTANGKDSY